MKVIALLSLALGLLVAQSNAANLVCYYDSSSFIREGLGKLLTPDLEIALQFCSHLIYGYAGINPNTYQMQSLHEDLDIHKHQYSEVTALKRKYPHLKVLLSVGGDQDIDPEHPNKYLELLEGEKVKQTSFINSAYSLVRSYGFDGLDLAFQFPKNKPRKVHSEIGMVWKKFKKLFTGDYIVDEKADQHKEEFTAFVRDVKNALRPDNMMLTLTVLPNVNSTWYFDIPALISNLDFVTLATFDFLTPERNPNEADFTAPLYELYDQDRLPHLNVNFQVEYWLAQQCPASKLNVGIAAYGRAWRLTPDSGLTGAPVVKETDGPAPAGMQSQKPGLLSWPEVCAKLPNPANAYLKGADAPLRRVSDPTKRYGSYAFRPSDSNGDHGMWLSYEDPDSAANKAAYVHLKNLGGLALFDLSYDDFRGLCTGDKYPILRAAKFRFYKRSAKFTIDDLNIAMKYCSHLIYDYVDINADTFQIMSVNKNLDIIGGHFTTITALKKTFPNAKFFLSVSGPFDQDTIDKYINLLEAGRTGQSVFINSALDFLRRFNFDGLDLSIQLPRNKPRKVHTDINASWKNFKKIFTGPFVVDERADEHREAFTDLVKDLKSALTADNKLLSLTVLPNVNSSWYFDGAALAPNLDMINLFTFDFVTPERNLKAADYTAPLCEFTDQSRLGHYNVIYQVEYWILQRVPRKKIHVGIATFGRAWKMTKESGTTGLPVVTATDGPAAAGPITQTPGVLNWLEICKRLPNSGKNTKRFGPPLQPVYDPTKCYGSYAFHPADEDGDNGIWVSYEDPETAASKAEYVKSKTLGGVALYDITLDDFGGQCTGEKFPIMKAIKPKLW
ncbi:chitinase-like protein Idgf2 [Eurosta solidaginis]|uniref:chitinase-like protein Idgf2 n=1 Tax=Eurosta solidaginis TaxID=178769 RepID=UPI0035307855